MQRTQTVVVDPNCVTPEEIDLILSTLNAASFNFVASNVPVGGARSRPSPSVYMGRPPAPTVVLDSARATELLH